MADMFNVSILAPEGKIFEGAAESLIAPASRGYVGILAHHAPFITTLGQGKITVRDSAGKVNVFDLHGGGFLEVSQNKATLLIG
jgi:F-type H+-transporting ATPase subunit epsilon